MCVCELYFLTCWHRWETWDSLALLMGIHKRHGSALQPFHKAIGQALINMHLPYNSVVAPFGKTNIPTKICMWLAIAALFLIGTNWRQPIRSPNGERVIHWVTIQWNIISNDTKQTTDMYARTWLFFKFFMLVRIRTHSECVHSVTF